MIEDITKNLVQVKQEFAKKYSGSSQIQEIIPSEKSEKFPVEEQHLELLHTFAKENPIYYNSYNEKIFGVDCIVYEGDINEYWINSIQHESSHAPFSPTWIFSAYLNALFAKECNYKEIIDIGSGDGRIAYCAKILDCQTYSIELDDVLVDLQELITKKTHINFNPNCADAVKFDYSKLNLTKPIFFIGGLAQMGGGVLASGIIEKINSELKKNSAIVFAGTLSKKYSSENMSYGGWGTIVEKNNLKVINTIMLPTVWTFKEPDVTPYVFTEFG